jgi:hypothetical protein
MKSLKAIQDEFRDKRRQEDAEGRAKMHQAREELDALLRRAGFKDGPENMLSDDADKWTDEEYYRRRVREMVFKLPEFDLRKQIMREISSYRYEVYDRWEKLSLFDNKFAAELKDKRCEPPGLSRSLLAFFAVPLAVMCLAYWRGSAVDALVAGFGVVLPVIVFLAVHHVGELRRYDVITQEAIKFVEQQEAVSKGEASRRLHLPALFSNREERTGEAGPEDDPGWHPEK